MNIYIANYNCLCSLHQWNKLNFLSFLFLNTIQLSTKKNLGNFFKNCYTHLTWFSYHCARWFSINVTFWLSPPNAEIWDWTHFSAITWSSMAWFPGADPKVKKPSGPNLVWIYHSINNYLFWIMHPTIYLVGCIIQKRYTY